LTRRKRLRDDASAAYVNEPRLQTVALEETPILRKSERDARTADTAINNLQLFFLG
jgi:hypothetical protein